MNKSKPQGFNFFAGLAIFIGAFGFIGNILFLALSASHGLPSHLKAVAPAIWLSVLHLFRDAGYVAGGVKVKQHLEWARRVLLLCAAVSLLELFYNTAMSISRGQLVLAPSTMLYFLLPLLIEGSVLVYFARRTVSEYVQG